MADNRLGAEHREADSHTGGEIRQQPQNNARHEIKDSGKTRTCIRAERRAESRTDSTSRDNSGVIRENTGQAGTHA